MASPHDLTSNITDTALIFEGGGMRASYTAAPLAMLLLNGIYLDWVGGISAGSSHTVNYLSRDPNRARTSFVEFAANPKFGNWGTFLRGRGFFDGEYIYEQTSGPGEELPLDFETFQANPATYKIGAFNAETGEHVYWGREDITSFTDLAVRVRASSSMPGVMRFPVIDGETYADGALGPSGGIPLDAAQADGYDKFLVIMTRPRDFVKEPVKRMGALRAIFRKYPAVADGIIARTENYNRTREELFELEAQGKAMLFLPDEISVSNRDRSLEILRGAYETGWAQAEREYPAWREFLGLPPQANTAAMPDPNNPPAA